VGIAVGVVVAVLLASQRSDAVMAGAVAAVREQAAADRDAAVRAALEHVGTVSSQALAAQGAAVQRELAAQTLAVQRDLAARQEVIGSHLGQVQGQLHRHLAELGSAVQSLRESSAQGLGEVQAQLAMHARSTESLAASTQTLREALASPKARGQWGERMAEDVLRLAGFVEHVNYTKQRATEGGSAIPDFTFTLPKGQQLYLDVKFPLSAYLRYLEAQTDSDRSAHRAQFLKDVRLRIRELADRQYPSQAGRGGAIDTVLLFIPNESVSAFVHEADPSLIDDALRQKIVLCSPLTLFAMLGVIRQAHDAFQVEQTSDEILRLMGAFDQQWQKFGSAIDTLGKRLDSVDNAFRELSGPRRNQLTKVVAKVDDLRQAKGLAADPLHSPGADIVQLDRSSYGELGA
jgi:DNA recombination protein RmuC